MNVARHRLFANHSSTLLVLLFLAVALVPVWCSSCLPLQDYPQNLFQAKLTVEGLAGGGVESAIYQVRLKPTYSAFFLAVWLFHWAMPVELAGKAAVSIYFVLTAAVVRRLIRLVPGRFSPAALLLFPVAFNQIYILGFFHYLYAIPVLVLALLDLLEAARAKWGARSVAVQGTYLLALLWLHPFALAIYVLVAAVWLVPMWNSGIPPRRIAVGMVIAAGLALAWVAAGITGGAGATDLTSVRYESPVKSGAFLLYLFTGLRGPTAPDLFTVVLWALAGSILACGAFRERRGHRLFAPIVAALAVLTAAALFSPFATGNSSYLNVRIAVPIYFLLVVLASFIPLGRGLGVALGVVTALLVANWFVVQLRMSEETAEIRRVIVAMEPGAMVLPLIFDRDSPECDGYYFSPHLNDHFYYQLVKGGASPYLLEAPREGRAPVSFRKGMQPPAPEEYSPEQFRWEKYGQYYRYFLVRGGSPSLYQYMERASVLRVVSGKWRLYERQ